MNCFQQIPESCGASHSPCGGAPQQRGPLTPQTQTRPNRLHTHTHPPKRLAHPRSPIPPLSTLTSRAAHAHPTSPRSTGFCAVWGCISSSSVKQAQSAVHEYGTMVKVKLRPIRRVACDGLLGAFGRVLAHASGPHVPATAGTKAMATGTCSACARRVFTPNARKFSSNRAPW